MVTTRISNVCRCCSGTNHYCASYAFACRGFNSTYYSGLFTCGIATLIQTLGFGNIGGRIPMIQGVTFASVGPMAMIGAQHGMTAIYGAIIIAGIFTFLVAPFF